MAADYSTRDSAAILTLQGRGWKGRARGIMGEGKYAHKYNFRVTWRWGKGRGAAVTQAARAGGERREGLWGGASGVALSFAASCCRSLPPARERGGEGLAVSRLSLQRKRDLGPQVEGGRVGRDSLLFSHSLSDSASIA